MELIVDLHIHSRYSRATSKDSNLEGLYRWGKIKGINIIGTGDFTHPAWFAEIQDKLEPAEPGLFKLRQDLAIAIDKTLPASIRKNLIRFALTVEISNIYSKNEKVRKLHNLVIMPSVKAVSQFNSALERIGNLKADGRPILGLDSKQLLTLTLDTDPSALFVPAHIWTPWFSMFGSKSGFNSIDEAFEELAPEIKAIETGLSSDPFMNWRLKELQKVTIISNSDAHSPQKLGREATILQSQVDYHDIINGIKTNDRRIVGTIEFFPQEGKYHYDGHRACNIRFSPKQTKNHQGLCPVCHQSLTVGVDNRVNELANLAEDYQPKRHKVVEYIIPLIEILAEMQEKTTAAKAVQTAYQKVILDLGNEFTILRKMPIIEIKDAGYEALAKAIVRMRQKEVHVEPGYDGVFGTIKLFTSNEERKKQLTEQIGLGWET